MVITKSFYLDINTPWKAPTLYIKQGDVDSRKLQATIRKDGTNYSIPGDVFATFRMHKPDDTFVTQDCTISGSVVSVVMDAQCATAAGHGKAEFILQTASEVVSTFLLAIEVMPAAVTDGDIESRDALGEYRTILEEMLRVKGAPLVANTAADMTDTDRVYVYTGSEVGYVNGDWYYYDGDSWEVGGVYNSQAIGLAYQQEVAQMVKQSAVASESDSTPYLYRPTPNPSAILADEEIVGGTVAWNQLVNPSNIRATTTSNGITFTNNGDGSVTVSGTATANTNIYITGAYSSATLAVKGKTLIFGVPASVGSDDVYMMAKDSSGTEWGYDKGHGSILSVTSAINNFGIHIANGKTVNFTFRPQVVSLTSFIGSQIADYLYTLESGTAGAGVAKLREWGFLSKVYFPYNAGELVSVNTEGKRVVGPNECYHEPGTSYNIYNGGHLIPVKAGEKIYVYGEWTYTSSASMWGGVFATPTETSKNNKLVQLSNFTAGSVKTYDITTDGYFGIAFNAGVNTYDVTKMMISRINTTYQPYRVTTYHTTPTDLNGIFKLDANNQLYADGDVYKSDGTITRNYTYRDYEAGDESLANAITDGVHTVVKKNSPTTETADPYPATQIVGKGGTEERIDNRAVPVPVGHNTTYYIGVPDVPASGSNLVLKATASGGKTTLKWE